METIYTIPVNENFDKAIESDQPACPYCLIREHLEQKQLDFIMGAAMMEPDTRIQTNRLGFCPEHYEMMFGMKNRLSLALMLESYLDENRKSFRVPLIGSDQAKAKKLSEEMGNISSTCYVCDRIASDFEKIMDTSVYMWERDADFRKKFARADFFCETHYRTVLDRARARMGKKDFSEFFGVITGIENTYYDKLREDVKWFIKKFDYRFKDEPWYDAKDAVERALKLLK